MQNTTVRRSAHSTTPRQKKATHKAAARTDRAHQEPRVHSTDRDEWSNGNRQSRPFGNGRDRHFDGNGRRDNRAFDNPRRHDERSFDGNGGRPNRPFTRNQRDDRPFGSNRREDRPFGNDRRDNRSAGSDRPFGKDRREDRPFGSNRRDDRSVGRDRRDNRAFSENRRDNRAFTDDRSAAGNGRRDSRRFGDDRRPRRDHDNVRSVADRPTTPAGPSWDGEIVDTPKSRQHQVTFADLGLPNRLLDALTEAGIDTPFPIQAATLPDALSGRDVLGRAQTGSGKTLAFGLALLTRLADGRSRPRHPRGLILVPTRELAMQVEESLRPLARALGLWCRTVVGGMSFTRQADHLQRGVDLLIATPGRLSDHVRQGTCMLDDVRLTALDEADQMADMGFLPQVRAILDLVPGDGQRLLFSATLDKDVSQLVDQYLTHPVTHSVSPATAAVDTMDHHLLLVSREDKQAVVTEMAARDGRTILFLRTKHHVDRLTKQLRAAGVRAGALHGGKAQGARNRVLGEFKDGSLPVLVATDVAARGIHVDGISLVVHVDPPADAKGYLHRAGRTARAGETGTVVTLVTHQERRTVFRMTEQAGVQPERTKVAPGNADLVRITGARIPSGEPVVDPEPTRRPPRGGRFGTRPGRSRRAAS